MDGAEQDDGRRPSAGHRAVTDPDPLDPLLPRWHWRSRHTAFLATPPAAAFAAAGAVTLSELPATAALRRADPGVGLLEDLVDQGFVPFDGHGATVRVLGRIGHLWQAGGRPTSAGHFGSFAEPGFAKVALLLAALPYRDETVLVTESRVLATDERTLEGFSRQWLVAAWSRRLAHVELVTAVRARLGIRRRSDRGPHG